VVARARVRSDPFRRAGSEALFDHDVAGRRSWLQLIKVKGRSGVVTPGLEQGSNDAIYIRPPMARHRWPSTSFSTSLIPISRFCTKSIR
jgi:hypothetical protein